jgi:GT2 family glycosyltransferase
MPSRRFVTGDGRRTTETWQSIPLVRVDVDTPPAVDRDPSLYEGQRIWIEAVRNGQVVGIVESHVGADGLAELPPETLAASFPAETTATPRPFSDDQLPRATVVVPTICRDPASLARTMQSLLRLDYPSFDIVLVDNRRGEHAQPLPEFPEDRRLRLEREPQPGASAARNRGVRSATGEFVAFTDDDAVVERKWLRALGSRFALDERIEAIGGLVLPSELTTEPQLWFEEFYGGFTRSFHAEVLSLESQRGRDQLFPYEPARFGAGVNMAVRREALERIGGFNTALGPGTPAKGGEDQAVFIELVNSGSTVAFEPAALVRHSHRRTEEEFLGQVFTYGIGLTAMLTAVIARDPSQARSLIKRVPAGLRLLMRPRAQRSPSQRPSYPRRAHAYQLLGMAIGPFAYASSTARVRWPP